MSGEAPALTSGDERGSPDSGLAVHLCRALVYAAAAAIVARLYLWSEDLAPDAFWLELRWTQWFAVASCAFLYLALLPGPLYAVFPELPGRRPFTWARRALGVSATVFAALHAWHGFFGWVGGFAGLRDWSLDYNLSLLAGAIALIITFALTATSFDWAVRRLGPRWKRLHRWIHPAGVLILVHAVSVTIHVMELQRWLEPAFALLVVLYLLKSIRFRQKAAGAARRLTWPVFAAATALTYWSFFLISHHRH